VSSFELRSSPATRSNEFLWRASFGVMVGLVLAIWLWIMLKDFV
jgi:NhaP-type Na+/H+ or K+/H+ antiporter